MRDIAAVPSGEWFSAFWTAVGAVAGWLVSAYYHRKRPNVKLLAILLQDTVLFTGVDQDVKQRLNIEFDGSPVEDLTQVEVVFANRGSVAIERPVRPLTLTAVDLESSWDLLDVAVVDSSSPSVGASVIRDRQVPHLAQIEFDLLNPDDFFRVKVLLAGAYSADKLKFSITASHVPAQLPYTPASKVASRRTNLARLLDALPFLGVPLLVGFLYWWLDRLQLIPQSLLLLLAGLVGGALFYMALYAVVKLQNQIKRQDPVWDAIQR